MRLIQWTYKVAWIAIVSILYINTLHAHTRESTPRVWANLEYLYWWIEDSPVSVPLITENNNPSAFGFINEQGTQIVFGKGSNKDTFDFGGMHGGRLTMG